MILHASYISLRVFILGIRYFEVDSFGVTIGEDGGVISWIDTNAYPSSCVVWSSYASAISDSMT